ncbi:hypothetical protein BJ742DRAFT_884066 [Cladochytrium replicatum]|nr:hypothetical protein BJ742DRAFT_884066 [Cladochytrium replicatum]
MSSLTPPADLLPGRVLYTINAIVAVGCFVISAYSFGFAVANETTQRFRNGLLLAATVLMSVESVQVDIELFLSPIGRLSVFATFFRLLVLSSSLNIIVCAQNSADFNSTLYNDPLITSILTPVIPMMVAFYGSYVVFLPALYKANSRAKQPPPEGGFRQEQEIDMADQGQRGRPTEVAEVVQRATRSLLQVEIGVNAAAIIILLGFVAFVFLTWSPVLLKSLSTLQITLLALLECSYVYLVRLFTGARSLYDRMTIGGTGTLPRRKQDSSRNHLDLQTLSRAPTIVAPSLPIVSPTTKQPLLPFETDPGLIRRGDSHNDKALSIISAYGASSPLMSPRPAYPPMPMQQYSTATKVADSAPPGTQFRLAHNKQKLSEDLTASFAAPPTPTFVNAEYTQRNVSSGSVARNAEYTQRNASSGSVARSELDPTGSRTTLVDLGSLKRRSVSRERGRSDAELATYNADPRTVSSSSRHGRAVSAVLPDMNRTGHAGGVLLDVSGVPGPVIHGPSLQRSRSLGDGTWDSSDTLGRPLSRVQTDGVAIQYRKRSPSDSGPRPDFGTSEEIRVILDQHRRRSIAAPPRTASRGQSVEGRKGSSLPGSQNSSFGDISNAKASLYGSSQRSGEGMVLGMLPTELGNGSNYGNTRNLADLGPGTAAGAGSQQALAVNVAYLYSDALVVAPGENSRRGMLRRT